MGSFMHMQMTFEEFLKIRGNGDKNISEHLSVIRRLGKFDRKNVQNNLISIKARWSGATANKYLGTYRLFAQYLVATKRKVGWQVGWIKNFPWYKEIPPQRTIFSQEELEKFRSVDDHYTMFFDLFASTGARPSELTRLKRTDFGIANAAIQIQKSKTGLGRTVYLSERLAKKFEKYLQSHSSGIRGIMSHRRLFPLFFTFYSFCL